MPNEANITESDEWFIGSDKTLQITVYQSDGTTAQDITNWALRWVLMDQERTAIKVDKSTGDGISITDAANGVCQVTVADTDTNGLTGRRPNRRILYYHELRRTDAGNEDVLAYGRVELLQGGITDS